MDDNTATLLLKRHLDRNVNIDVVCKVFNAGEALDTYLVAGYEGSQRRMFIVRIKPHNDSLETIYECHKVWG